jgi:hypothetical protein
MSQACSLAPYSSERSQLRIGGSSLHEGVQVIRHGTVRQHIEPTLFGSEFELPDHHVRDRPTAEVPEPSVCAAGQRVSPGSAIVEAGNERWTSHADHRARAVPAV